uniref:Uncharacterized protein n=1 Tax=Rhizophora mucronata TaxID=61149 RepID=A0A2P2R3P0_RHIMU
MTERTLCMMQRQDHLNTIRPQTRLYIYRRKQQTFH